MKIKEQPYQIALTGFLIAILFHFLPMDPGYELALAYVPIFFIVVGLILAGTYWILTILTKRRLRILFYVFFIGNLMCGIILTFNMASN